MTADRISHHLYQGSAPPEGSYLYDHGFKVLVLTAFEHQPPSASFPGVKVIRCPLDDNPNGIPAKEWEAAIACSKKVAEAVLRDKRTLVTCFQGRNRSGLVVALTIWRLTDMSGKAAVSYVKARRENALTNPAFVSALSRLL